MDRVYSLSVYETPTHFYIIGSDPSESRFRTLKIDRITQREFFAGEPDHDYSKADIGELLATVSSSSIVTPTEKWGRKRNSLNMGGLLRTLEKACALIGAVRFLQGYYLLLVSKAKQVCQIGMHAIYKVEDVSMIYLPSNSSLLPEEQRYAKLFQTVDFTTNFYFSYTYNLSRTLQENCLAEREINWNRNNYRINMKSEHKFVWNDFLLEPFKNNGVSNKWYVELVHGYIGHQKVELPCAKLDLILVARRSKEFAGTRFLKRGTNYNGDVANDVETEQILWETNGSPCFRCGKFSAFVQRRGSVPLYWSQDSMHRGAPMVVGKPPIVIDCVEPNAFTTAIHFHDLSLKYGHPIIVLNLVKRMAQKHNENLLHDIFSKVVQYLNQFRHHGHCIDYISFDVSRCNKKGRVLQRLDQLGQRVVLATGWFQSFSSLISREPYIATDSHQLQRYSPSPSGVEDAFCRFDKNEPTGPRMLLQHGILRSNCVDCLDRTNVVQFGIGKVALCWQLYSMGLLDSPWPQNLHPDFCRVFEELYDEHGDTLAWQYAGSHLVHSIKTYKRTAAFQERSRDVLQTLSRYYSNTFSDFEKQDGINLFLGIYRVHESRPPIWSLGSDHYIHFPITAPRPNNFLCWSMSVSSDNEDEDWKKDDDFHDWVFLKAAGDRGKGEHVQLDIFAEPCAPYSNIKEMEAAASGEEKNNELREQQLFALSHRTYEFTSLEQLLRQHQQIQQRRPLALESLRQNRQGGGSFMWMFKNEHSPSPPLQSASTVVNRLYRNGICNNSVAASFSSLATGTASIVLKGEERRKLFGIAEKDGKEEEGRRRPLLLEEEELAEEADEQRVEDYGQNEGTLLLMALDAHVGDQTSVMGAIQPREAAALAIAAAVEAEEKTHEQDLIIIEDRNAPCEKANDAFGRFTALLNGEDSVRSARRSHSASRSSSNHRRQHDKLLFGISTGLKSPREVYFRTRRRGSTPRMLAISEADMALYNLYAASASGVFEKHNLRRQRRPTAWKLTNHHKDLQKNTTATTASITPQVMQNISPPQSLFRSPLTIHSAPGKQQRQKDKKDARETVSARASPAKRVPLVPHASQSSPFRKEFCRLGPAFEFRPSSFSEDTVFHVNAFDVCEESMHVYRRAMLEILR